MLDRDPLTPAETQEQNQHLIQDLSHYYDTRAEDSASLARIRARLLERAQGPLPLVNDDAIPPSSRLLQIRRERNTDMNFVHMFARDRGWHSYLNLLVAALLLFVLVGSFIIALHAQQGTAPPPQTPPIAHSWSLLAKFSGTGTRTITRQNIAVGQKYGWIVTCTSIQEDLISIDFNGKFSSSGGCAGIPTVPLRPDFTYTSPVAIAPIHTIKVTADASISWELLLLKGTYYPPLNIDAARWHTLIPEIDATGGTNVPANYVILPKTWALQFVCYGTGDFTIELQSGQGYNVSTFMSAKTLCNGQVAFHVYTAVGQGKPVVQMEITTDGNNDWQAALLGCTNGKPNCA